MIKKILIRIIVLVLVFLLAVFCTAKYMNRGTEKTTREMKTATLPIVYMKNEGTQLNGLHGYLQTMDLSSVRDTLTPLTSDRILDIQIQTFGVPVDDIYFEVLSLDGEESLENTKVNKYQEDGDYINASLKLQNLTLMNQEYVLKIQVRSAGKDIYYYTRILQQDGLHAKSYLDFVLNFYDKCLNKSDSQWLSAYTEPDDTGSTTSLNFMNIHCTAEQLSWGELNPQIFYKPIPEIKEINESTASVVLEYMIASKNEEGKQELYDVKEFYRMRSSDSRIMLLDFERTTEEVFNPENQVLTTKGLNLGITGRRPEYITDAKQNYFVFAQSNELYSYNSSSNKLTQIFSFREKDDNDRRNVYERHNIHLIHAAANGNVYFTVSGYMNRGNHEGESGVILYSYEEATGNVTERAFVKTQEAFELLKKDLQNLTYVTDDQEEFYFLAEQQVYGVSMASMKLTKIIKDVPHGGGTGSETGKQFAWIDGSDFYKAQTITVMDLDTKERRTIKCKGKEVLKIIGFMGEDLVYGIADAADINQEHAGNELFPLKTVKIVNSKGETVKEYSQDGVYITDTKMEDTVLTLSRAQKSGKEFTAISEDHIVTSKEEEDSGYGLTIEESERKQTEMILKLGETLSKVTNPSSTKTRQVIFEGSRTVDVKLQEKKSGIYYVYAKGKLDSIYENANMAVRNADEKLGVVVDVAQRYVWERGNREDGAELDLKKLPEALKKGNMDVSALAKEMPDSEILDLSGCTLDMMLYYVSHGHAVLVETSEGIRLMTGYDPFNTILLKPGEEETYYYPSDDSKELFENSGNVFISYISK